MSPLEAREKFIKVAVFGVVAVSAVIFAFILSISQGLVVFAILGGLWVATVPRHAELCMNVATATLVAGLLVPFLSGRPLVWEAMGLLGWSGVLFRLALRKYHPDFGKEFKRNIMILWGIGLYSFVLLFLMRRYGVGFGALGSADAGGKRYLTQIICGIFPLVYLILLPSEKTIASLFAWQCLLALSYLPPELILNYGSGGVRYLLLFFDASSDAWDFAAVGANMGMKRIQAFAIVASATTSLLLAFVPLRRFFTVRGLWLAVVAVGLTVVGGFSGHRYTLYTVATIYLVVGWVQRMYRPIYLAILLPLLSVAVAVIYLLAPSLPESMQRSLTIFPYIHVGARAYMDAESGLDGRAQLLKYGYNMIPKYYLVGRGFGVSSDMELTRKYDNISSLASNGIFYNGTISLLVNTGLPGTISMMTVICFGFGLCWRTFALIRKYNYEDRFALTATVLGANYVSVAFSFVLLHGDSEAAMKSFCPQLGLIMVCYYRLRQRDLAARGLLREPDQEEVAVEVAKPNRPYLSPVMSRN